MSNKIKGRRRWKYPDNNGQIIELINPLGLNFLVHIQTEKEIPWISSSLSNHYRLKVHIRSNHNEITIGLKNLYG